MSELKDQFALIRVARRPLSSGVNAHPTDRTAHTSGEWRRNLRTWALVTLVILTRAAFSWGAAPAAGLERLYLGTYTTGSSRGIYQASLDLANGAVGPTNLAGATTDPSFLALHPTGNSLYAVNESGGAVVAFSVNRATGGLTQLNQQSSNGGSPCHVVVDNAGSNVLVANYSGGSVTVFPIKAGGSLGAASSHIQHPGSSPHAHCISLDASNQFALVCDLGLSRVYSYHFNSALGTLTTNSVPWTAVPAGAGPRHLAFDPSYRHAYVICEYGSTIIGFNYNVTNGTLSPFQTNSSLPSGWSGQNSAAEIAVHPSGRFLYGSNRGYNSVAVFGIDSLTGRLTPVQQQPVGQTPRHFAIDPSGGYCLVACQDANCVQVYTIDPGTGGLTATVQTLRVSLPVCVLPLLSRPPQPVLEFERAPANTLKLDVGNSLTSLTYQMYAAASLGPAVNWTLVATGQRGQTNFTLTNASSAEFFRVSVLTNY
jgi:6-phosphogluconolactonase